MKITSKERVRMSRLKDTPFGVWDSICFPLCRIAVETGPYRYGKPKYKNEDIIPQRKLIKSAISNYFDIIFY